jgi:predicted acetyltransferase
LRYLDGDLPFSGVTGVTTGRVARGRGAATKLAAWAIARSAEAGVAVFGLSSFEQGFYERLGMGTGS